MEISRDSFINDYVVPAPGGDYPCLARLASDTPGWLGPFCKRRAVLVHTVEYVGQVWPRGGSAYPRCAEHLDDLTSDAVFAAWCAANGPRVTPLVVNDPWQPGQPIMVPPAPRDSAPAWLGHYRRNRRFDPADGAGSGWFQPHGWTG